MIPLTPALSAAPITLGVENFLHAHPELIQEIGGHALMHVFFSYARSRRRRGVNRRKMRKASNMKRRWFVDNIIMHHRRLHAQNRQLIVSNARQRALQKKKGLQLSQEQQSFVRQQQKRNPEQGSKQDFRTRIEKMRGRVDDRRARARSRWLTVTKVE